MARTPSTMLPLGTSLPSFHLPDTDDSWVDGRDVMGPLGLLVMFICNHCPFVIHVRPELVKLSRDAQKMGFGVVAINSNDVENYPEDSPAKMREYKKEYNLPFPYLFDATQSVAKVFQAACTPDFYLFDRQGKLVYRGQMDDSRPGSNIPVTGKDLRAALEAIVSGKNPADEQKASLGCNIKWKGGNEPQYFSPPPRN